MAENQEALNKEDLEVADSNLNLAGSGDGSEYYLGRNRNLRIMCSKVKDEVEGVCTVNFKQPLPQFDTAFGKAYSVTMKLGNSNDAYAIVLDKKYPIRLVEINKLSTRAIKNLVNVMTAQIIPTSASKGRVFTIILEKPQGTPISEYIKKVGKLNPDYIARKLIPLLSQVIFNLERMGITHGKINASNIYIDDNGDITIGECVSEMCGYSQPIIYETTSRASAMPVGKGVGSSAVDYYAMGALVAILLRGKDPTEGLDADEILNKKFEEGTYKIATENLEIPLQILDLLRGLLTERKNDIWGANELQEWIKGRRFNLLPPADDNELGRPIIFNGKKYRSRKYLVHGMYQNWDEAKNFVKQDTIIRWINRNAKEGDLVEHLEMVSGRYGRDKESVGFDKDDSILVQYMLLLDPAGPFRLKGFSANIDGIGTSLADGFAANKRHAIDAIENIISHNLHSLVLNNKDNLRPALQEAMFAIQKCAELLRKRDFGFGIERCLYNLNLTLPCQSPMIVEDIVFSKEELLIVLDNNESIGGTILDRHMAAFLSERLDLLVKIHISSMSRFPEFSANMFIQVLALLSLVQQTGNMAALPKLSEKIYNGIKNVVNEFHSKTIRNELDESLKKVVKKGILSNILRIISDPKFLVRDRIGFKKATNVYRSNAIQIIKLSNIRAVNNVGYRYGLQLTVMASFFVATLEIITLMLKAF